MNCLFISNQRESNTGGKIISDRNLGFMQEIFGTKHVASYTIPQKAIGKIQLLTQVLRGNLISVDSQQYNEIKTLIENRKVQFVFLDNSLMGNLCKKIKADFPLVKVGTFFHNTESSYFKSLAKTTGKLHHKLTANAANGSENKTVKYGDFVFAMNSRDAKEIKQFYGKNPDFLLPTSLHDDFEEERLTKGKTDPLTLLFLGARFFPNEEGVRWFIKEVMPTLTNVKLLIVGKGFEGLKQEFEKSAHVQVIGTVDNPADFYYQPNIVISPIFSGSGMKTKTAEAFKFAKYFLGTDEAFEGYDVNFSAVGKLCNTPMEFRLAIDELKEKANFVNPASREIFLKHYESRSLLHTFKIFLHAQLGI